MKPLRIYLCVILFVFLLSKCYADDVEETTESLIEVETVTNSSDTKKKLSLSSLSLFDLVQKYPCDGIFFKENNQFEKNNSSDSVCLLPGSKEDYDPQTFSNLSPSSISEIQFKFTVPDKRKEKLDFSSYLKCSISVCSEYASVVLVRDTFTKKIIHHFINPGSGRSCHTLKSSMSDTDEVEVEFVTFVGDMITEKITSEFMHKDHRSGTRQYAILDPNNSEKPIFELDFSYTDISFKYFFNCSDNLPATQTEYEHEYVPNSVMNFVINKHSLCPGHEECNSIAVGVIVEIKYLDLDFDKSDYLLIGPGENPVLWENTKAQIVSHKIETKSQKRQFWVNADSAFVMVVTHNSLKTGSKAVEFSWTPANHTINLSKKNTGPNNKLKMASLKMCFIDQTCMSFENTFQHQFVNEFVHLINNYLIDYEQNITVLINPDSVLIFDKENSSYITQDRTTLYCQINVAVASPYDKEYPLVDSDILEKMFFEGSHSRRLYKSHVLVTNCITENITYWNIILPILVILAISTIIMAFFWTFQNKMLESKSKYLNEIHHDDTQQDESFYLNEGEQNPAYYEEN